MFPGTWSLNLEGAMLAWELVRWYSQTLEKGKHSTLRSVVWPQWTLVLVPYYCCSIGLLHLTFPGGSEPACNVGDPGSIPGSGRSPGEENRDPFQHSCLENSMDRAAWCATVHGVSEWDMSEWLNFHSLTGSKQHKFKLQLCRQKSQGAKMKVSTGQDSCSRLWRRICFLGSPSF